MAHVPTKVPKEKLFVGLISSSKVMLRSLNKSIAVLGRRAASSRSLSTAAKVVDTDSPVIPVISVSTKVHEDLPGKYTLCSLSAAKSLFVFLKRLCSPILYSVSFQDVTLANYRIQSGLKKTVDTISSILPLCAVSTFYMSHSAPSTALRRIAVFI